MIFPDQKSLPQMPNSMTPESRRPLQGDRKIQPRSWGRVNYADFFLSSTQNSEAAHTLLQSTTQAPPQYQRKTSSPGLLNYDFAVVALRQEERCLILLTTIKKKSNLYNMFLNMGIKC